MAQTDHHNTQVGDRLLEFPDVAGGDALPHIPAPNMLSLSATQILDVAEVNDGLGGEIDNPDGSNDRDAFLNTTDAGIPSFGGGEAPGVALDDIQFGTFQRDFPAQTPATNRRFTNFNEVLICNKNYHSGGT